MEQQNSIKSELNTLIMLEQQQTEALHALNNKAGYTPTIGQMQTPMAGSYAPNFGGFQSRGMMAPATAYAQNIQAAQNFAAGYGMPGMDQVRGFSASAKNALVNTNLDSMNPFWANQSKMSSQAIEQASTNLGEKMATGTLSAASVFSGMGGQYLGGALAGGSLVGSLALGAVGGWALGTTVDIMADQVKQNYAYDRYLQQNSYRFINVNESNNTRSPAGFNRDERWQTANYLRHFGSKMKISDDDTMMLLKQYTEGDLLRSVSDTESFKKQMETLTKSVKTMALSLNDSYEEIAKMMAELKKKGINTRDYKALSGEWRITGGITGQDGTDVANFQVGLASSITQGTFANNNNVLSGVNGAQQWLGKLFDDAEKNGDDATYQAIINANSGDQQGAEGATEAVTSAAASLLSDKSGYFQKFGAAFFDYNDKTGQFTFNQQRFDTYAERLKSGNMSINDLSNIATTMYQNHDLYAAWESKSTELLYNSILGDYGNQASMISAIAQAGANMSGHGNWSLEEQLRQIFGIEGNAARLMAMGYEAYGTQGGASYLSQMRSAAMAQTMLDEYNSNRVGFGYEVKNWWQGVKDYMGDSVAPVAGAFNKMGENIGDWWYGKQYKDVSELWSGVDWSTNPYEAADIALGNAYKSTLLTGDNDIINKFSSTLFGKDAGDDATQAIKNFTQQLESATEAIKKQEELNKKNYEWYNRNFIDHTNRTEYDKAFSMNGKQYSVGDTKYGQYIMGGAALGMLAGAILAPFTGGLSLAVSAGYGAAIGAAGGWASGTIHDLTRKKVNGANYAANYWNETLGLGIEGGGQDEDGNWKAMNAFQVHDVAMGVIDYDAETRKMMADGSFQNLPLQEKYRRWSDSKKAQEWLSEAGHNLEYSQFDVTETDLDMHLTEEEKDYIARLYPAVQSDGTYDYGIAESEEDALKKRRDYIEAGILISDELELETQSKIRSREIGGTEYSVNQYKNERAKEIADMYVKTRTIDDKYKKYTEIDVESALEDIGRDGLHTLIAGTDLSYNALDKMTNAEAIAKIEEQMNAITTDEDFINADSGMVNAKAELLKLDNGAEIIAAIDEGRITNETELYNEYKMDYRSYAGQYLRNKNTYDKYQQQYGDLGAAKEARESISTNADAREAAFATLASAYGMSNKYIRNSIQNQMNGFEAGTVSSEKMREVENNIFNDLQNMAFEGVNYSSITEDNSEDIISAMTSNLASGGVIKAEEAYSLASQFVTSQLEAHGGNAALDESAMRDWVQLMLGNVSGSESAKTSTYQKDVVSLLTDIRDLTAQKGINSTKATDPVSGEQRDFHSPATTGIGRDAAPTENSNGTNIASQNSSLSFPKIGDIK